MTDEPNGHSADDDNRLPAAWTMPKPIFRSSEGVTPKNRQNDDASLVSTDPDLESESGPSTGESLENNEPAAGANADRIKVIAAQPKAKSGGCAFSVVAILLIVAIILAAVIVVLGYFYYSSPPPDPFNN